MNFDSQRGVALVLALMILAMLAVLGGALITSTTLDVWVDSNYVNRLQSHYLAEAGLESAREQLRETTSLSSNLETAAGADARIFAGHDVRALLAGDDQPFADGQDATGKYRVWLRNDAADGVASTVDRNKTVTLWALGEAGTSRKVIEAVVRQGAFPALPSSFPPDVAMLDPILKTVGGLEQLIQSIASNADTLYRPAYGAATSIGNFGEDAHYRVGVVEGDCQLGPGTGFGLLVVRGNLTMEGSFVWNGLIVVIGQGVVHWGTSALGQISGGLFVARTRDGDRSPTNLLGTTLLSPGTATIDLEGAGVNGIRYDPAAIDKANAGFPYQILWRRDY